MWERWSPWSVATFALIGGFAAFRMTQAVNVNQGIWQDSYGYDSVAHAPIFSAAFWAGSRAPLTPLLLKFTGTPLPFCVVQTCIAIVAWTFLALTVGGLAGPGWRRLLAVAAVLAFACTLPVTEWDWSVLSESLTLSALAAIFAFAIRFARTRAGADAFGIVVCCAAFALVRDEDVVTIALFGVATAVWGLASFVHTKRTKAGRTATTASAVASAEGDGALRSRGPARSPARITVLLGLTLIALAIVTEVPVMTSQRDVQYIHDILVVRIFPFPDRDAWFGAHGMPDARALEQLASEVTPQPNQATVLEVDVNSPEFSSLGRWITDDGDRVYLLWLAAHPGYDLTAPFANPPLTFNNAGGDLAFYASAQHANVNLLDRLLFPGLLGEIGMVTVALGLAAIRSLWRKEFWVVGFLAALGPVTMLIAWQGEAQEVTRHMVIGSVETRLAVLLLLVIAALATPTRSPGGTTTKDAVASPSSLPPPALAPVPSTSAPRSIFPGPSTPGPKPASTPRRNTPRRRTPGAIPVIQTLNSEA